MIGILAGLSPLDAVRTAMRNPASYFVREKDMGSVESGKLADLVLLDADTLKDIRNMTKVEAVIAAGQHLDRKALDEMPAKVRTAAEEKK